MHSEPLSAAESVGVTERKGEPYVLNVTLLERAQRHSTIFKYFDALKPGESFQILNDHDPKPLYYQFIAERGQTFTWQYLEKGALWWRVQIGKPETANGETVGELAAKDARKAEVFKRYGIDFCCGGKKSLRQACAEKNIEEDDVKAALDAAVAEAHQGVVLHFDRWEPDFLADYIYNEHHRYYYEEGPVIADLLEKITARHGAQHPNLHEAAKLYKQLQQELNTHFTKEEKVLFPFIKALVTAKKERDNDALDRLPSLTEPVQMMEADHEAAGEILAELKKAANGFVPPEGSCNSFGLLYYKLSQFETDLHQHVHLENNILFPKALALEKELRKNHS